MTRETYSDRVSRIAHDHNVNGRTARSVAAAEMRIEGRMREHHRERARLQAQYARMKRATRIRRSHVEGARYGRPVLIHNGGKP